MEYKLITTKEAAKLFGLSARTTKALLKKGGLNPINVSRGNRKTYRWLESAVLALIQNMHTEAQQPKTKKPTKRRTSELKASVLSMDIDDLFALTQGHAIQ